MALIAGFSRVVVSGQDPLVADRRSDTLTIVAGAGVTITTDADTDTITFVASAGGGGSDTYILSRHGFFRVASSTKIYGHEWDGVAVVGQWTEPLGSAPASAATGDTLTLSESSSLAYMSTFIAPKAGTVERVQAAFYLAYYSGRYRIRVWKATPVDNSSADLTWTAIGAGAVNANANDYAVHTASEDLSSDANNAIAAGDLIGITVDGRNIGGTNYGSSSSNNRGTFDASVVIEWS